MSGDGWAAVAGGAITVVPQLLAVAAGSLSADSRLIRKIERDVGLLASLPADAKAEMEVLLAHEVHQHALRRMQRVSRKLNRAAVGALIFMAGVTAIIGWVFASLAITYAWGWWIPFGIFTLLGLGLSFTQSAQLYEYPDETRPGPHTDQS